MKFLKENISFILIIIGVLFIRSFVFTPAIVSGTSMEDTLYNKDLVLVTKYNKNKINRNDIVIAKADNELIIKRVIGLPNEEVEYKNDILYINGKRDKSFKSNYPTSDFKLKTKSDEYVLLGDNRVVSKDSRFFGTFNKKQIKGKVNLVFYPFSRFGKITN